VVISGVTACPAFPLTSLPNGSYELDYVGTAEFRQWHLVTSTHDIALDCVGDSLELFIFTTVGDELVQFAGTSLDLTNGTNLLNTTVCGTEFGEPSAFDGTATVSW
jgi:hypothetical protein